MPGTIHLVDDDGSPRAAMTRLLNLSRYRVRAYETGQQLLDALPGDGSMPACTLLDLQMRGLGGLDVLRELSANSHPPVITVSAHGDVAASVVAMKCGAVDVLEKPVNAMQLRRAVGEALKKHVADQSERLVFAEQRARIEMLTPREHEVLRYIISGRLNKVIASELSISEKTVKVHRARVLEKMRMNSVAELARTCALIGVAPAPASRLRLIAGQDGNSPIVAKPAGPAQLSQR